MRYLSICSGIEAASVAWHGLGWTPVAFSEIEPFPSAVLAHHYPSVPNLGDMTNFKEWNLGPVDLLVGGTPCQSFSVAGLRKGLHDPRGGLMLTFLEIAQRYRPRWVVWENVPGVLSSDGGRDFGAFLGALGELGYGWAYRVLDAQWFGVAQRRRRVFVVGCLGDQASAAAVLFESESVQRNPSPSRETRQGVARGVGGGPADGSIAGAVTRKWAKGSGGPAGDECYNMVAQPVAGSHWDHPSNPHPTLNQSAKGSGGIAASDQELFSQRGSGLVPQPVTYDLFNVTAPVNRQNREPGDPCHTLARANAEHAAVVHPAIAWDEELNASVEVAGTLLRGGAGGRHDGVAHPVAQPVAFHPTQDPISSTDGTTHAMGCGSKQGTATVAVAHAFKIRGGVEREDGSRGSTNIGKQAGKGYLGSDELAFTVASSPDQYLAHHVTFAKTPKPMSATDPEGWSPVDAAPTITHWPRDRSDAGTDVAVVQPVGTDCYNGAITGDVAATIGTPGSSVNASGPTVMQAVGSFKPGQSAAARSIGYETEIAPSLEGGGGGNNKPAVHVAMQVRRLTPVECERLQGFPDGYTNIPWRKKPEAPDGPRYKALGNSMAVPCMRWIGERIQAATARQEVKP